MLILYSALTSTTSQKVKLCLAEKQLDYENHAINIGQQENLSAQYLKINPDGVVPTLVADNHTITESSVINEYLDEVYPFPALMPKAPIDKATVRTLCAWQTQLHHPYVRMLTYFSPNAAKLNIKSHPHEMLEQEAQLHPIASRKTFLQAAHHGIEAQEIELAFYETERMLKKLELLLQQHQQTYFIGQQFTLADIAWIPVFDRLQNLQYTYLWEDKPNLVEWWKNVRQKACYKTMFSN